MRKELHRLTNALLDDDQGISEYAFNQLLILWDTVDSTTVDQINQQVDAIEDRFYSDGPIILN